MLKIFNKLFSRRQNTLNAIESGSDVDVAVFKIVHLVKTKEIVFLQEAEEICSALDTNKKNKVFKKLKKYNIKQVDGNFVYDDKYNNSAQKAETEILHRLLDVSSSKTTSDLYRIGTSFYEGIVATGFPEYSRPDWLRSILKNGQDFDFSLYIAPEFSLNLESYLRSKLKHIEDELYTLAKQNINSPELESAKKDILDKISKIEKGKFPLYRISFYLLSKGVSEEKTKSNSNKLISLMHSDGIEGKYATNYQRQLFLSMVPVCADMLGGRQIIVNSKTLATAFPFRVRKN